MTSIKELLSLKDGDAVNETQGNVTQVFQRREVKTRFGTNTVQGGVLQDASGAKIELSVWGHPDIETLKGKEVVLHANQGKGLKIKYDSYTRRGAENPTTTIKLEVDKKGTFQLVAVYEAQKGPEQAKESNPSQSESKGDGVTPPAGEKGSDAKGSRDDRVANYFGRLENLYLQCWESVASRISPDITSKTGMTMTPDQFQSCVSCLFIQANKDNVLVNEVSYRLKDDPF